MNMSAVKKQKIDDERRVFNSEWCTKFIVVPHNQGFFCLIYQIWIAVIKEYNFKCHHTTQHSSHFDKIVDQEQVDKINPLKNKVFLPLTRNIQNWWENWVLSFVNVWQKKESLSVTENLLKIVWQ